ncbi:MAG: S8 family serine peptidase [Opitutales bacterium]|nr:S8 family serine peptidase [Opitutales bacterium]
MIGRNCFLIRKFLIIHLALLCSQMLSAQPAEKIVITEADQLPRVSYPFEGKAVDLVNDSDQLSPYLEELGKEITNQLQKYDIRDESTLKAYMQTLRTLDFLNGNLDGALEKIISIREMQDKPADKLTSGLIVEALISVLKEAEERNSEETSDRFEQVFGELLNPLHWELVQDSIEQMNGTFQFLTRNLYLGSLENQMQVTIDENQELTLGDVQSLASIALMMDHVLPFAPQIVSVSGSYIEANRVVKEDIWERRNVDLSGEGGLSPVVIAIWDSGVDMEIFKTTGQSWLNTGESLDSQDNDENGWVDDLHGIAWDKHANPERSLLYPLTRDEEEIYPKNRAYSKGLSDLQAAIDSDEAKEIKKIISNLSQDDYKPFFESLSLFGNYMHGTHVAGIAAEGNPAARILSARLTFGHEMIPDKPTLELAIRESESMLSTVQYFRAAGVRVVNMSWGGNQLVIEAALEANGVGDNPEQRAKIARVLFDIGYDSLVEAMAGAPEILFIAAAGNSDVDVDFTKDIPASIDLPNVMVVGAVDQAGDETSFTSYGKNVKAHASGFEVDSYVPGGTRMKFSGTSMAAPNVANLAGKLLAIKPDLSPLEVKQLIELSVDKSEDGRRFLVNPLRAISMLRLKPSK